jgi:hypothetical protein
LSFDSQRIAFETELIGAFGSSYEILFDTVPDDDFVTKYDEIWLRCYIDPYDDHQKNMGTANPLDRTLGMFVVEIFDREENGSAEILRIADSVKELFKRKTYNGETRVDRIKTGKRPISKGWNCRVVNIMYHSDETSS